MKNIAFLILLCASSICFGQKISNRLSFHKGSTLAVTTDVTSSTNMDIMGQSMSTSANSSIEQDFKVTEAGNNSARLEHTIKKIKFKAEGMGQSQSFDSDNENDRNNEIGKSLAPGLKSKYTVTVNDKGIITGVTADTVANAKNNDPMIGMLLGQLNINIEVPKPGDATVFTILPDRELSTGTSWTDSSSDQSGKKVTDYTINNISGNEVTIDFKETSTLNTTQQIMGFDATIHSKSNGSGQLIIDRNTGILKYKKDTIKSEQTIEAQGQKLPSTSSVTIITTVK